MTLRKKKAENHELALKHAHLFRLGSMKACTAVHADNGK
jgi:hypothetical protein